MPGTTPGPGAQSTAASSPTSEPTPEPTSEPSSEPTSEPTEDPSATPAPTSGGPSSPPAEPAEPVTLAFGGDIHFEGSAANRLANNPKTALGPIRRVLSKADLAMANLETAITTRGTPQPKAFTFRAPATAFTALRSAGIDVVTQANNHTLDFGQVGLRDSLAAAKKYDFPVVGIGADEEQAYAARRFTIKGQRISVIGVTNVIDESLVDSWTATKTQGGVASAKRLDRLEQAVADARKGADAVIVYLHWGAEGAGCPTEAQRMLERKLVAAGADVIVGGHAHLLLGGGWDQQGPYVDYGLGNFAFYATSDPGTETGVLWLDLVGRKVVDAEWIPARIVDGIPLRRTGAAGQQILDSKNDARSCTGLLGHPPR